MSQPATDLESAADSRRRRILDAAFDVCDRCGVEGARMDEVAARARVSKGALYQHFESKHDLLLASVIDSYEESLRLLETAGAGEPADPLARIERILAGLTRILAAMARRMTVHYQAFGLVAGDPDARARLYGFLLEFFTERAANTADAIRRAQAGGAFAPEVDPDAVTDGVLALLSGFLYRATFDPEHADPARLEACFDALIRSSLYLRAPEHDRDG